MHDALLNAGSGDGAASCIPVLGCQGREGKTCQGRGDQRRPDYVFDFHRLFLCSCWVVLCLCSLGTCTRPQLWEEQYVRLPQILYGNNMKAI